MIRVELSIDKSQARMLAEDGWNALRPDLLRFAQEAANEFVRRLRVKLAQPGLGKLYRRKGVEQRASAPGAPPAGTGEYRESFDTDTKSFKRSVHGRIGSPRWNPVGRVLEFGSRRIRPRPHVKPVFDQWAAWINRQSVG